MDYEIRNLQIQTRPLKFQPHFFTRAMTQCKAYRVFQLHMDFIIPPRHAEQNLGPIYIVSRELGRGGPELL